MPVKDDYEREFTFDIDGYLIANYSMTLSERRAIVSYVLSYGEIDVESVIEEWIANRALIKQGWATIDDFIETEETE